MKEKNEKLSYNSDETNKNVSLVFQINETFRGNQMKIVILYSTPCVNEYCQIFYQASQIFHSNIINNNNASNNSPFLKES